MTRQQELSLILKYIYKFKESYPNDFSTSLIYSILCNYKITNNALDVNTESITYNKEFENLQVYFKNRSNIRVFDHIAQPGFLQFNNVANYDDTNYVKLYLTVNPESFEEVVKRIFEVVRTYPQIKHLSKVSITPRSDQIVLRIKDFQYAKFIADFINNDHTITSSARFTNPFIPRYGIVGFAYDMDLSYNYCVSHLVYNYIMKKSNEDEINNADYYEFIKDYFSKLIDINGSLEFQDLINSKLFNKDYERLCSISSEKASLEYVINNYLNIFEEIMYLYNSDAENNLDYFEKMYYHAINPEDNKQRIEYIKSKLDAISKSNQESRIKTIIDDYIKYAYFKYGSVEEVGKRLTLFAKLKSTDNITAEDYITRDKDFRKMFSNIEPNEVFTLTNFDIYSYVEKVLGLVSTSDDSIRTA